MFTHRVWYLYIGYILYMLYAPPPRIGYKRHARCMILARAAARSHCIAFPPYHATITNFTSLLLYYSNTYHRVLHICFAYKYSKSIYSLSVWISFSRDMLVGFITVDLDLDLAGLLALRDLGRLVTIDVSHQSVNLLSRAFRFRGDTKVRRFCVSRYWPF